MTAKVRSMLLAASLVLFACLLFSGGQRLIGCDAAREQVVLVQPVQAALCAAPTYMQGEADGAQSTSSEQRAQDAALPAAGSCAQPRDIHADANGNVLASGVSYLRTVHQAFALGDGFA